MTISMDEITRESWPQHEQARARVLKNWEHIPIYLEWGHLEDIYWDGTGWI